MEEHIQQHIKKGAGKYYLVSFFAGAGVMVVEVTATRLLTPHFGGTLFIWTSTITVILAALAAGYFLGSKFARQKNTKAILAHSLFAASFFTLLIPYAVYFIAQFLLGDLIVKLVNAPMQLIAILAVALITLMPAALTYGLFSPLIIEILGRNGHHPGEVAGKVFAVSTFGSILGTISAAIFFIPFIGTHSTFVWVSASMLVFALWMVGKKSLWYFLVGAVFIFIGFWWRPNPLLTDNVVYYKETPYQSMRLFDEGDFYSLVFNEGLGVQSMQYKETPYTGRYWDWLAMLPFIRAHEDQQALIVGFAGGTIARLWAETPAADLISEVDAVEVDKEIVKMDREFFSNDDFGANVHIADGRNYLAATEKKYNFMQIDAFSNELQIPFQFSTVEFMRLAKSRLKEDGIFTMNMALGYEGSALYKGLVNTTAAVFENVYTITQDDGLNVMVLASREEIDINKVSYWANQAGIPKIVFKTGKVQFSRDKIVLTDDKAPTEWLSEAALFQLL